MDNTARHDTFSQPWKCHLSEPVYKIAASWNNVTVSEDFSPKSNKASSTHSKHPGAISFLTMDNTARHDTFSQPWKCHLSEPVYKIAASWNNVTVSEDFSPKSNKAPLMLTNIQERLCFWMWITMQDMIPSLNHRSAIYLNLSADCKELRQYHCLTRFFFPKSKKAPLTQSKYQRAILFLNVANTARHALSSQP